MSYICPTCLFFSVHSASDFMSTAVNQLMSLLCFSFQALTVSDGIHTKGGSEGARTDNPCKPMNTNEK